MQTRPMACLILTGSLLFSMLSCGKAEPLSEEKDVSIKQQLIDGVESLSKSDQLYFEDGLTITGLGPNFSGGSVKKDDNFFCPAIRKMTGVDLDILWVDSNDYLSSLSATLLSGVGSMPDIINASDFGIMDMADDGVLVPLDQYLELMPNIVSAVGADRMEYWRQQDGHIYSIPSITNVPGAQTMMVRKDWLDKLGLSEPESWEDWVQLWRAIRDNDLNGNGDPNDEIPFASQFGSDGERCLLPLLNAFGIEVSGDTQFCLLEDGRYTMVYEHPRYPEFLQAMQQLYAEGLISADFDQMTLDAVDTAMDENRLGTVFNWAERCRTSAQTLRDSGVEDALWAAVEPVSGPYGDRLTPERLMLIPIWCVTSAAEESGKAEDIIRFFNWYYSEEGSALFSYGLPGISYDLVDGKPVMSDELVENGFTDYRAAGCNNESIGGLWQEGAFMQCLFKGNNEDEMDDLTEEFYKGISVINTPYFYTLPKTYQTSAYVQYRIPLITEGVCKLRDRAIKGELTVDEFYEEYGKLKERGLQQVIDAISNTTR